METTARITLREGAPSGPGEQREEEPTVQGDRWPEFVLCREDDRPASAADSTKPVPTEKNPSTMPEQGLRKRHTQSQASSEATTSKDATSVLDDDTTKGKGQGSPERTSVSKTLGVPPRQSTPLAWFSGGMVSPALREAKADFSCGVSMQLSVGPLRRWR